MIGVFDSNYVTEAQFVETVFRNGFLIERLDVVIAARDRRPPQTRAHDRGRHDFRDGYLQCRIAPLHIHLVEKIRIAIKHPNVAALFELKTDADRAYADPIAQPHLLHHFFGEVDNYVFDAAVLAGHDAGFALRIAADDGRRIADAREHAKADVDLLILMLRADRRLD